MKKRRKKWKKKQKYNKMMRRTFKEINKIKWIRLHAKYIHNEWLLHRHTNAGRFRHWPCLSVTVCIDACVQLWLSCNIDKKFIFYLFKFHLFKSNQLAAFIIWRIRIEKKKKTKTIHIVRPQWQTKTKNASIVIFILYLFQCWE